MKLPSYDSQSMRFSPISMVLLGTLLCATLSLSGCLNLFSPLDQPSGDAQYLSAARACFDKMDFSCAQENYSKISSANNDVKLEEEAILVFAKNGASMVQFMTFVSNLTDLNAGKAVTIFANGMIPTASSSSRQAIWSAWQNYKSISNNDMKFFVQFIGSLALAGEILAEAANGASSLSQADLVFSASTCAVATACTAGSAHCAASSNGQLTQGPAHNILTTPPTNSVATSRQLFDSIASAESALQSLDQGGRFSSAFGTFNTITSAIGNSSSLDTLSQVDECFRAELINQSIGLTQ